MTRLSLDGDWQLAYFPEGQLAVSHPRDLAASAHAAGRERRWRVGAGT